MKTWSYGCKYTNTKFVDFSFGFWFFYLFFLIFCFSSRCFFFGDTSSKRDPQSYLNYSFRLYEYFLEKYHRSNKHGNNRNLLLPLIINTAGWVKGASWNFSPILYTNDFILEILPNKLSVNFPLACSKYFPCIQALDLMFWWSSWDIFLQVMLFKYASHLRVRIFQLGCFGWEMKRRVIPSHLKLLHPFLSTRGKCLML